MSIQSDSVQSKEKQRYAFKSTAEEKRIILQNFRRIKPWLLCADVLCQFVLCTYENVVILNISNQYFDYCCYCREYFLSLIVLLFVSAKIVGNKENCYNFNHESVENNHK